MQPAPCYRLAQSRTLIFVGFALVLVAMLVGLFVPAFPVPKRAVSAHVLGITQGLMLAIAGLVWPRVELRKRLSIAATLALLYGCAAAWLANLGAAIWRAGGATFPMVDLRGTALQETIIAIGLRSAAIALVLGVLLTLVGLRKHSPTVMA